MKYGLLNDRRGKISNFFEKREQETEVSSLTKFNRNVFFFVAVHNRISMHRKKNNQINMLNVLRRIIDAFHLF